MTDDKFIDRFQRWLARLSLFGYKQFPPLKEHVIEPTAAEHLKSKSQDVQNSIRDLERELVRIGIRSSLSSSRRDAGHDDD